MITGVSMQRMFIECASTVIVAIAVLAACTPSPDPSPTNVPRIVTSTIESLSGMEAATFATLAADDDGCVVTAAEDENMTLVWPAGYSVRGDAESFAVVDGDGNVVAKSGQALEIVGGAADSPDEAWGNGDCVTGTIWMVGGIKTP